MKTKKSARSTTGHLKGISRIDQPEGHGVGWYARVRYEGTTFSKYFSDGAHGGTDTARRKAVRWRNAKEREIGKPRTNRFVPAVTSRNRTGVSGVYQERRSFVVATSPKPGVIRREFVSIGTLGVREAFRRAVALRRQREEEIYGEAVTPADAPLRPSRRKSPVRPRATRPRK
jgi:hypothetical protein